ncbi:hypothetical protein ACIP3A_06645 [Streptomyces tricolor]|uniref:hypothetical protein n=1 Tax=Streptomyces tricolor TaxID=68277 RepID=UPI003827FF65
MREGHPGPHDRAPGITVGAVLPREDVRDVLVLPAGRPPATLDTLPPGTLVGTSAPRRVALLKALHPQLIPVPIRGNADTRMNALDTGTLGADAMIAALAGLRRLGLADRASQILDPTVWLPAAGAGIVVIEHRADDPTTSRLLAPLTHSQTRVLLDAERAALAALRGGCLTAASVHAALDEEHECVTVYAVILNPDGGAPLRTVTSAPQTTPRVSNAGRESSCWTPAQPDSWEYGHERRDSVGERQGRGAHGGVRAAEPTRRPGADAEGSRGCGPDVRRGGHRAGSLGVAGSHHRPPSRAGGSAFSPYRRTSAVVACGRERPPPTLRFRARCPARGCTTCWTGPQAARRTARS